MTTFNVVDYHGYVVHRTDDWFDAEWMAHESIRKSDRLGRGLFHVRGTHPTHTFAPDTLLDGEPEFQRGYRCTKCGSPTGDCFMQHLPCGFDFSGKAFITILKTEKAAREEGK